MPSITPAAPLAWEPEEVSAGHQEGFPWHRAAESTTQPAKTSLQPARPRASKAGQTPANRARSTNLVCLVESPIASRGCANDQGGTRLEIPRPLAGRRQREETPEELRENGGPLSYRYKSAVIS